MSVSEAEVQVLLAGGDARQELLADGSLFLREVERIKVFREISDDAVRDANLTVDYYGLDPRERELLAIEYDFFWYNPTDRNLAERYRRDYQDVAAHLTFRGVDEEFTEGGWRLRWGADVYTVNRALGETNYSSTEALLGGRAHNLRGVIFNFTHEAILQEHALSARPLGLYPPTSPHVE